MFFIYSRCLFICKFFVLLIRYENMGKKERNEKEVSDLCNDLRYLKDDNLSEYDIGEIEKNLVWLILSGPRFEVSEKLRDFIIQKKRWKAFFEVFKVIWRLISEKNEIWFSEFNNLDVESLKLDEKDEIYLTNLMNLFEKMINNVSDIKKCLNFTYLLSEIKNKILERSIWTTDKEKLLKQNLEVWDIILLNKKVEKKDIWTKLLEAYDNDYRTDFWHAAIIISVDYLKIRHSTTFSSDNSKIWHVEDTMLNSYLKRCKCLWYDLLSLRPPKDIKNRILSFSEQNLWKDYDNRAALRQWIGLPNNFDDRYNCVEIIAQALDQENLKEITHPNQFLEYMNIFVPVYMTTIQF